MIQAGLYGQINRWFQNHAPKSDGETSRKRKKKKLSEVVVVSDEDDETLDYHVKELQKEAKKTKMDSNKVVRLLSLSYGRRREEMLSETAATRVSLF